MAFGKYTLEEVREKQKNQKPRKPLARRSNLTSKGVKSTKGTTLRPKAKKAKLPTTKSMRNKCDALLTPIIKKLYPTCIFTGEPTQVAHHAIKKSTASALRYYLPNLIPLTHQAHLRLHCDEITWTGRLIQIKGMEWWEDLERERRKPMKCDVHYYIAEYTRLKALLDSLD